jgi:Icc-related predicted phosphoesterase
MNIIALSDLHGRLPKMPSGILASPFDALILSGDITPNNIANWDMSRWNDRRCDISKEAPYQREWFETKLLPWAKTFKKVENIIFIAGNHDFLNPEKIPGIIGLKTGAKTITLAGTKIGLLCGSMPLKGEWNDEINEYDMNERVLTLDRDIEILVSHVPPMGVMDRAYNGQLIGSNSLRDSIFGLGSAFDPSNKPKPYFTNLKHHFYGHCHEARGREVHEIDGRQVIFDNVAETYSTLIHNKVTRLAFKSMEHQ